ncbi:MerR family transcriptional regulator [Microlunatus speluncae]|uniref:MerR family transcriptional regulator n=1 Tax=Microlunatus speluncae TaxID=2594267 RepID=UPI0012664744|nr:MerR family transcriptional regulator [Microlunatus speluncae]
MKIGELAELAGTTTRAVRHYHREGLLPEPPRRPNGYRSYGVRDLVGLVKIRRLRDAGLSLAEVRAVLVAPAGSDAWRTALVAAERRLAEEERRIRRLRRDVARQLESRLDPTLPAPLAEVLDQLQDRGLNPTALTYERDLALIAVTYEPAAAEALAAYYRQLLDQPERIALIARIHDEFDALADLDPDDPRVAEVARVIAEDAAEYGTGLLDPDLDPATVDTEDVTLFLDQFTPAQRRAIHLALTQLTTTP